MGAKTIMGSGLLTLAGLFFRLRFCPTFLSQLLLEVYFLWEILWDAGPPLRWRARGAVVLGLFYFFWPLDLLPDFFPLLGWWDDYFILQKLRFFWRRDLEIYLSFLNGDLPWKNCTAAASLPPAGRIY